MYGNEQTVTSRAVEGIQIPDGSPISLPAGTPVRILQSLGGTFTVAMPWGQMVRIDARDADAIGKEGEVESSAPTGDVGSLEERVWTQLRTCYDPEIPVNIVDLGLIYDCTILHRGDGDATVRVKMTLTAPGCGMGQVLADDVKARLESLPGVATAEVEIVFDPPWSQSMMSEAARLQLGIF